jgi:GGDEF domain-containing protein
VVGVLRAGDLIARTEPAEICVALPNTERADAEAVERRLRKVLPEAATGIAVHRVGDTVPDLLSRARGATGRKTR